MRKSEKHPVDIHIGHSIFQHRVSLGMSQSALGAAVGCTFQQIQKYERGHNRISGGRIWDIARALNTTPGHLYEGLTDGSESEAVNPGPGRYGNLLVVRHFQALRPKVQAKVLALLGALAASAEEEPESGALGNEGRLQA